MTININTSPDYRMYDKHLWADYAETKCIISTDKEYTNADMTEDLFEEINDTNVLFDEKEEIEDVPVHNDKNELFINDVFAILQYRVMTYGNAYPFTIKNKKITLKAKLKEEHKLYIYLLICSHLSFVPRSNWTTLTSDFEVVASVALKECLPKKAIVRIFGTSISSPIVHYTGNTYVKVQQLARDLSEKFTADISDFPPQASKDKGLDLVAWVPFNDNQNSRLVCFGQCKCSDKWPAARFSSSTDKWRNWINFSNDVNNFAFIPYCYRHAGGTWFDKSSLGGTIVIDRQRIMELVDNAGKSFDFKTLASRTMVEKLLSNKVTSVV